MRRPYILACILYVSRKNVFSSSEKFEHFICRSLLSHRVHNSTTYKKHCICNIADEKN